MIPRAKLKYDLHAPRLDCTFVIPDTTVLTEAPDSQLGMLAYDAPCINLLISLGSLRGLT